VGDPLDVAVVGAGPAGLAVAIDAARRGLSVVVFERTGPSPDKACGEGIMPAGVIALEKLGVLSRLPTADFRPFRGIRYLDADGTCAEGKLPGEALAVRRTALVGAMAERACEVGVDVRYGCELVSHRRSSEGMVLETDRGRETASILVAADGLGSRLRQEEGLDVAVRGARRFGLRRHFARAPWSSSVEVHLGDGAEAYVTPVSDTCVGVAFLWSEAPGPSVAESPWARLSQKFPKLMDRLDGAPPSSKIRGAGPLERASRARTRDRFALVGDAAGYVDAITGEGISLSLLSAAALARVLPDALARGVDRAALAPYERESARLFRTYALVTKIVLAVARRRAVRRRAVLVLRRFPELFDRILSWVA
jgi:2-polyprenyl-6-methoxyphenol hydroxylase-like FAD-dependent oxidoreductase